MNKYLPVLMSALLLSSTLASAQTYRNQGQNSQDQLQSKEGLSVYVSAVNFSSGEIADTEVDTAEQIHVTVYGSNVHFGSQVRVVLTPNCFSSVYGYNLNEPVLVADLTSETDGSSLNYTAAVSGALVLNSATHGGDGSNCTPELSVVVDGNWQTDPVNGTHNFKLNSF